MYSRMVATFLLLLAGLAAGGAETNLFVPGERVMAERTVECSLTNVRNMIDAYLSPTHHGRTNSSPGIYSFLIARSTAVYRVRFVDCSSPCPDGYLTATALPGNRTEITISACLRTPRDGSRDAAQIKSATRHLNNMLGPAIGE